MRRKTKVCPYCKAVFFIDNEAQIYCSSNHRGLAWKKSHPEVNRIWQRKRWRELHPEIVGQGKCTLCDNEFNIKARGQHRKFCSQACRLIVNTKRAKETGRKKIYAAKFREVHKLEIQKKDAEYKARTRFGTTSKTLNKQTVLLRDKKMCQLCENPYQVIHHIRYSGQVEDLVCLCRACHARLHSQFIKPPYWKIS